MRFIDQNDSHVDPLTGSSTGHRARSLAQACQKRELMTAIQSVADIAASADQKPVLEQILSEIDDPAIDVISFDVFDTLLIRPVLEPTDLFFLLEQTWREVGAAGNFPHWRVAAERRARQMMSARDPRVEEPTLAAIYEGLAALSGLPTASLDEMREAELAAERRWLSARNCIGPIFQRAVASGKRIVSISDCYLPGSFLKASLDDAGFAGIERVFVSCDSGFTKTTGRLYGFVSDALSVPTQRILHVGDNVESDFFQAKKAGLRAAHLPSSVVTGFGDRAFAHAWIGAPPLMPASRLLLGLVINVGFDRLEPTAVAPALSGDPAAFGFAIFGPALLLAATPEGRKTAAGRWAAAVADCAGLPSGVVEGGRAFAAMAESLMEPLGADASDISSIAEPLLALAVSNGAPALHRLFASLPVPAPSPARLPSPTLWCHLRLAWAKHHGWRRYVRALTGRRPL